MTDKSGRLRRFLFGRLAGVGLCILGVALITCVVGVTMTCLGGGQAR